MKVYVVVAFYEDEAGSSIEVVFSTLEKAMNKMEEISESAHCYVQERVLDE